MERGEYSKTFSVKRKLQLLLTGQDYVPVSELAEKMNVSRKTIYDLLNKLRDIDKIKIEPKRGKISAFRIFDENISAFPEFDASEVESINKNLFNIDNISAETCYKILKLVFFHYKDNSEFGVVVRNIKAAIKSNTKIKVGEYHARSGVRKNQNLTPVYLDEKSKKVYCYDSNLQINKEYNLDRMFDVTSTKIKAEEYPEWSLQKTKKDAFGFQYSAKMIQVKLKLSIFAKSLLLRQFPHMEKYLTMKESPERHFVLEIEVSDIQPIARFITGILDEVKIIGNKEAKELIKSYIEQRVFKVFDEKLK